MVGGALGHSWHRICMTLLEISWLWPWTNLKLQTLTSFSDSVETTALTQPFAVCQVLLRTDHRCTLSFGTKFINAPMAGWRLGSAFIDVFWGSECINFMFLWFRALLCIQGFGFDCQQKRLWLWLPTKEALTVTANKRGFDCDCNMVTANARGFTVTAKRGFECDFQKDTKVAYIYIYIYTHVRN